MKWFYDITTALQVRSLQAARDAAARVSKYFYTRKNYEDAARWKQRELFFEAALQKKCNRSKCESDESSR